MNIYRSEIGCEYSASLHCGALFSGVRFVFFQECCLGPALVLASIVVVLLTLVFARVDIVVACCYYYYFGARNTGAPFLYI